MTVVGTNLPIRNVRFHGESLEGKRTCHGDRESDVHDPLRSSAESKYCAAASPGTLRPPIRYAATLTEGRLPNTATAHVVQSLPLVLCNWGGVT